jgi:hypothetical protein
MSKCPKCDKELSELNVKPIPAKTNNGGTWKAIVLTCPSCSSILGTQIDPQAMDIDLLNKIRGMMLSLPK